MICSKCGAEVAEGAMFCTTCGAPMNAAAPNPVPNPTPTPAPTSDTFAGNGAPVYAAPIYMDPKDHTAEFSAKDISDNKVIALLLGAPEYVQMSNMKKVKYARRITDAKRLAHILTSTGP